MLITTCTTSAAGILWFISLRTDMISSTVISGALFALTGLISTIQLLQIVRRPKTALELDAEGLRFNASYRGRKTGKINWKHIQSIQMRTADGKKQLLVKFTQLPSSIYGNGLIIHATELSINFYEMETLILNFYHRYHECKTTALQN